MTRIYLVRHAEAEGNAYRRIHGQYDSRITPNGLRQVDALRTRFQGIPIDACYASDLNRTCVTARAVYLPKGLELRRDRRFREVNLGRWEDIPFGWLERFEPERMMQFNKEPQLWSVKDSETFPEYTQRFLTALREAAEENDGKTIAVFTHGCVLRGVQYLLGGNEWPPYCDNTAVSLLGYENGAFRIEYLNDSSHLSDEISTFARQKWWRTGGDRRDFNMWFETEGEFLRRPARPARRTYPRERKRLRKGRASHRGYFPGGKPSRACAWCAAARTGGQPCAENGLRNACGRRAGRNAPCAALLRASGLPITERNGRRCGTENGYLRPAEITAPVCKNAAAGESPCRLENYRTVAARPVVVVVLMPVVLFALPVYPLAALPFVYPFWP